MPRRSPGEIRRHLRPRIVKSLGPLVVRGLSPSAKRQIARFERVRRLPIGEVALALELWDKLARQRPRDYGEPLTDFVCDFSSYYFPARELLEIALTALHPKGRRELRAIVIRLDELYLARTVRDPFAPSWLRWWEGRLDI